MRILLLVAAVCLPLLSPSLHAAKCPAGSARSVDPSPAVNGWGFNKENHRFIAQAHAGITPANLSRLRLKWAFALPDSEAPRAVPLVTADTVVIADEQGGVYALDRRSGCEKWRFDAGAMVRTALRHVVAGDRNQLAFGTAEGELISLDLRNGEPVWRTDLGDHPYAMLSGSPVDHGGVIYQPVSSYELFVALNPFYGCCTFRSSVVAVAAADGAVLWRAHTIEEEPGIFRRRTLLPDQRGPSGAPVWSQPTLDIERGRLYVGTGENYSLPATDTSDAILAFAMDSGEMVWKQQFLSDDAWNVSCVTRLHPNCPENHGEDLDFGAPPVLVSLGGRDVLLAGQKSGRIFALDPDAGGALLWTDKAGAGGKAGGVHFAMAVDPSRGVLYVPISDRPIGDLIGDSFDGEPSPALLAYDIASGKRLWQTPAPGTCTDGDGDGDGDDIDGCYPGFSAAVTSTGELVFAPTLDGFLRVFAARSGEQLWSFDTRRQFAAVNGGTAQGGAIDVGGVLVSDGELFVVSGYGQFGQLPGNAFLVFAVAEQSD